MREIDIKAVYKEVVKMINHVISVEQQEKWRQLCRSIGWRITEIEELVQWDIWINVLEGEEYSLNSEKIVNRTECGMFVI